MSIYNIKETSGWLSEKVLLPLVPALVAIFIRFLYHRQLSWDILDFGILSFSMALSSILVMGSANRLNDKDLRKSIVPIFMIFTFFFLIMFAFSSYTQIGMEMAILDYKYLSQSGTDEGFSIFLEDQRINAFLEIPSLGPISVILTLFYLAMVVIMRLFYQMEE